MCPAMQNHTQQSQLDQVTERVERLLVRHVELQRTNALLTEQLNLLTHERDSLKSRLGAARARVDALLERLPEAMGNETANDTANDTAKENA
jgi:cell division protein ZapB